MFQFKQGLLSQAPAVSRGLDKIEIPRTNMRIGFDAKRAFYNFSGLGNYSRNVISYLGRFSPENDYHLYVPKQPKKPFGQLPPNQSVCLPESFVARKLSSFWRSYWLPGRLEKDNIELFHGLSNEIPFGIHKYRIKTIVTIHDLIFLRYPQWYNAIDRMIYRRKSYYSCNVAGRIIAISEQTRNDIIDFYKIPPEKITVVYQGCDPAFYDPAGQKIKDEVSRRYNLPSAYLLYVGTIEERKNLLNLVRAIHQGTIDIPLVIIGRQTAYALKVKEFISSHQIDHIYFLENVPNEDLPALYQMSEMFIYPALFEGFGIPVLEALCSGTPVITSKGGCFHEAGGEYSIYVDPLDPEELSDAIKKVHNDVNLRAKMIENGYQHALKFRDKNIAENIMEVYREIF